MLNMYHCSVLETIIWGPFSNFPLQNQYKNKSSDKHHTASSISSMAQYMHL